MTRKDYIVIAKALRDARVHVVEHDSNPAALAAIGLVAFCIGTAILDDNPRFDREHFLAAARGERNLQSRPPRR